MACSACEGTGYDTTGFEIWCPLCLGSRLVETVEAPAVAGLDSVEWIAARTRRTT